MIKVGDTVKVVKDLAVFGMLGKQGVATRQTRVITIGWEVYFPQGFTCHMLEEELEFVPELHMLELVPDLHTLGDCLMALHLAELLRDADYLDCRRYEWLQRCAMLRLAELDAASR